MNSVDYSSKQQLREKISSFGPGNHSFEWDDNKIYYISKFPNKPVHLGVVKLAEKALARGGFGKVYDVHSSDLELVFKLSRKRVKDKKGEMAKEDICNEYKIMQYIAENAKDLTGLNYHTAGLVSYKNQIGIFLEKFTFNGLDYLNTHPSSESRIKVIDHLFRGLDTLHRLNILHRDLKLENTLIKGDAAVIADFGNACKFGSFFKEKHPHPETAALFGRPTKQNVSALLVFLIQKGLEEIKDHPFGSEEYTRISKVVLSLIKRSDQFSMALQAYMIGTNLDPQFPSYKANQYLQFDYNLTGKQRMEFFDEMSKGLHEKINSKEITHSIKKYLKIGLNF